MRLNKKDFKSLKFKGRKFKGQRVQRNREKQESLILAQDKRWRRT